MLREKFLGCWLSHYNPSNWMRETSSTVWIKCSIKISVALLHLIKYTLMKVYTVRMKSVMRTRVHVCDTHTHSSSSSSNRCRAMSETIPQNVSNDTFAFNLSADWKFESMNIFQCCATYKFTPLREWHHKSVFCSLARCRGTDGVWLLLFL